MLRIRQFLLATVIAIVAVACGSGGSGMSQSSGTTPLIATGTITGFGSIYVNGIHFQTTSATIRKNAQTVDQSQLAVGEVARIKGSKNDADSTGVADEVDVDEAVIGPIDKIDTTGGTVTVLAQIVKINAGTSFSKDIQPADITGLKTGDVIHVSGMTDSSGAIVATRIEKGSASSPLQVVGTVAGLNAGSHTFMINALTVDYSSANLTGFASGAPSNGDVVEAQGTSFDATTQTLTATHVQREMTDQEEAGDDRDMEREGLITRFASATDFDVAGKPVTTTSSTEYRNGTAADLALNVKVELERPGRLGRELRAQRGYRLAGPGRERERLGRHAERSGRTGHGRHFQHALRGRRLEFHGDVQPEQRQCRRYRPGARIREPGRKR